MCVCVCVCVRERETGVWGNLTSSRLLRGQGEVTYVCIDPEDGFSLFTRMYFSVASALYIVVKLKKYTVSQCVSLGHFRCW